MFLIRASTMNALAREKGRENKHVTRKWERTCWAARAYGRRNMRVLWLLGGGREEGEGGRLREVFEWGERETLERVEGYTKKFKWIYRHLLFTGFVRISFREGR